MLEALGKLWAALGKLFGVLDDFADMLSSIVGTGKGMAAAWEEKEALLRIKERKALERSIAAEEEAEALLLAAPTKAKATAKATV